MRRESENSKADRRGPRTVYAQNKDEIKKAGRLYEAGVSLRLLLAYLFFFLFLAFGLDDFCFGHLVLRSL